MNIRKKLGNLFGSHQRSRGKVRSRSSKQPDSAELIINFLFRITYYIFFKLFKTAVKKFTFYLKTDRANIFLHCPIRGQIGTRIYDDYGNFTEEYHRINLVKAFLKKGFPRESLKLNHRIHIGHKGRNFFIPDLVVTSSRGHFFLVSEIKKFSSGIQSAIDHQLNPAMKILGAEYGIYYDGTKNSTFFLKSGEPLKKFNFVNLPDWIMEDWSRK